MEVHPSKAERLLDRSNPIILGDMIAPPSLRQIAQGSIINKRVTEEQNKALRDHVANAWYVVGQETYSPPACLALIKATEREIGELLTQSRVHASLYSLSTALEQILDATDHYIDRTVQDDEFTKSTLECAQEIELHIRWPKRNVSEASAAAIQFQNKGIRTTILTGAPTAKHYEEIFQALGECSAEQIRLSRLYPVSIKTYAKRATFRQLFSTRDLYELD